MDDSVHLRGLHDTGQEGVAAVGADVLRPLERDRRSAGAHAEEHLDLGLALESGRHPTPPERVEAREEYASAHQPNQTLRRWESMS